MRYLFSLLVLCIASLSANPCNQVVPINPPLIKKRILVGGPVRQKPAILREFLSSLGRLETTTCTLDYFFIDDNIVDESHEMLLQFKKIPPDPLSKVQIGLAQHNIPSAYVCDDLKHYWNEELVTKVAAFKDVIIKYALEKKYDYLFLIDSDLVLHPHTMEQLLTANRDIVSNIFWTKWHPDTCELPQVWLMDEYKLFAHRPNEEVDQEEQHRRIMQFLTMLKNPGVYEVGGLGACTLISRNALLKGVNFSKIKNVSFFGEDRDFCIRACALGLGLYVDTHLPAYHIYRESELKGVPGFIASCSKQNEQKQRLTLSMVVKNEAGRYLRDVLRNARTYITDAVIIDDASTDDTVKVCEEELQGIPLKIVRNTTSKFKNEVELRKQQWEETIQTNPDWILSLDADEIFETRFATEVKELISDPQVDVYCFRLYDFWDLHHYREDLYWQAHAIYRPFLIRYKPGYAYQWNETPLHCGRFPKNIFNLFVKNSELRLKHFGWASEQDRLAKYERYKQQDSQAQYGSKAQYESILDKSPRLISWQE